MVIISSTKELEELKRSVAPRFRVREDTDFTQFKSAPEINVRVCRGSGCTGSGSEKVSQAFEEIVKKSKLSDRVAMIGTGCHGLCEMGPIVLINPGDTLYTRVKAEDVEEIVRDHLLEGKIVERLVYHDPVSGKPIPNYSDITFYLRQERRVLHNNGFIDPWSR